MSPHQTQDRPAPTSDTPAVRGMRWYSRRWAALLGALLTLTVVTGVVLDFLEDDRVLHDRIENSIDPPYGGS